MTAERIETIVGRVPVSWKIKTLEEISNFITKGGTPTTYGFEWADEGDGIPFLRSECVTDAGFNPKGMNYISAEAHVQMSRSEIKPGDLLMSITGNIGRVAKAPKQFKTANINQHIARIRILEEAGVCTEYVHQCLKHDGYSTYYRTILTGQAYPQISLQQVRETRIALPLLPEQKKIAAILTAVDDKLDVIARQIEATQTLKQGLMQTLFSQGVGSQHADGRWQPHTEFKDSELGKIPVEWQTGTLEQISEFITKGGTPTTYGFDWASPDDGIPFFRSECVTNNGFNPKGMNYIHVEAHNQMNRSQVEPGDLLMTITGNIGRVARAPADFPTANINQHIARIRIREGWSADFVYQSLRQDFYAKHYGSILTGQAYPQISLKQVRETLVALPPSAEQQRMAEILADFDAKIASLSAKRSNYRALKRGLMQKLLTGEWRVNFEATAAVIEMAAIA
ncbi:restriction endonuclease subunit S [Paraburkholderia aromaticivorans]|uniref:restriction endonuclease subunit S n=1 Tax=Paraburkholderia aromaticivorans TaxID=2026199 RepID=UPI001455ECAA|nr:restriction endonuclease subunit S [Paraburkholderia aromaticivorans]